MAITDVLTLAQAAAEYDIPQTTLKRAAQRGALRAWRPGHDYLTTRADVEAWRATYYPRPTRRLQR